MLPDVLQCPRCERGALRHEPAGYICTRCSAGYPVIGGMPWLFHDPQGAAGEWRARLALLLGELHGDAVATRAALAAPDLQAATRERLARVADALEDHGRRLTTLLAPLQVHAGDADRDALRALRTRLPVSQALTTYYVNIHRDWAWGDAENRATLDLLDSAAGESLAGARVLVLGAGAGRLAHDLHLRHAPALTVATDLNPMLLSVAREMYAGRALELYEFPLAPRGAREHAILRTLRAPAAADDGLQIVAADAMRAPFRPGAFDVVVTPWFIDIVEEPFPRLAAHINSLVAPGGRWLNVGSVAFGFMNMQRALQYGLDEVLAIVRDAGFSPPEVREAVLPYMQSPASRHARLESTVAWSTRKLADVPRPASRGLPDWFVDPNRPVPLHTDLQAHARATRIHAFVMSLIDGRRNLNDIARVLVEQRLMKPEDALPAVRTFMLKMQEDATRRTNL
ncbi:MAG: methyltransferase domain-containing protein [Steroidobacteraceae bacterium]